MTAADLPEMPPLPCPVCNQPTASLKSVTVPFLLFLVIAWGLQRVKVIGCPSCARKRVMRAGLVNIPTANLLWPIVVLPWTIINLVQLRSPGHATDVIQAVWPNLPRGATAVGVAPNLAALKEPELQAALPAQAAAPEAAPREASPGRTRAWGVFQMLFGAFAAGAVIYVMLESWYQAAPWTWVLAVVAAAAAAGAGMVLVAGILNIRLRTVAWRRLLVPALGCAAVLLLASPLLARYYWVTKAAAWAESDELHIYMRSAPPQVWQPGPTEGMVEWKSRVLEDDIQAVEAGDQQSAGSAYADVRWLLDDIETHHAGDAAFQPLAARLRDQLIRYKDHDPYADAAPAFVPEDGIEDGFKEQVD